MLSCLKRAKPIVLTIMRFVVEKRVSHDVQTILEFLETGVDNALCQRQFFIEHAKYQNDTPKIKGKPFDSKIIKSNN